MVLKRFWTLFLGCIGSLTYAQNTLPQGFVYVPVDTVFTSAARYVHFQVQREGVPVFGQTSVLRIDKTKEQTAFYGLKTAQIQSLERTSLSTSFAGVTSQGGTQVWFPTEKGCLLAFQTRERVFQPSHWWEILVSEQGDTLLRHDLLRRHSSSIITDTTVTGYVFLPDPLTKAGVLYGGVYTDANDANNAILDPLRTSVSFPASYSNGLFTLANSTAVIQEFSSPSVLPATSSTPSFYFNRSQDGFEDVNALYHVSHLQQHLNSLGFNLVPYVIPMDVHANSGDDNSYFDYSTNPPRLYFGEGGVDDAEDADVLLHEYGHAISHSASPNSNFGTERESLDEALGDYLATSYSRFLYAFGWQRVFTWDGHNEFWDGRRAVNSLSKMYPQQTFTSIYEHTDLFVDALMHGWQSVGRDTMDRLVIESVHSWTSGMGFDDAANRILSADTLLYNGAHAAVLHAHFALWQILPTGMHITEATTVTDAPLWIVGRRIFSRQGTYDWELMNTLGQSVASGQVQENHPAEISGITGGVYLLRWKSSQKVDSAWKTRKTFLIP